MPLSPYIAGIRRKIGADLLLLPTVAVVVRDDAGRLLLVEDAGTRRWMTIGGTVEPDESPEDAVRREAEEEAGIAVEPVRIVAALGGPAYRIVYPGGDQAACVPIVYEARLVLGTPTPDGEETSDVRWVALEDVLGLDLNDLNRALLTAVLPLLGATSRRQPPSDDLQLG